MTYHDIPLSSQCSIDPSHSKVPLHLPSKFQEFKTKWIGNSLEYMFCSLLLKILFLRADSCSWVLGSSSVVPHHVTRKNSNYLCILDSRLCLHLKFLLVCMKPHISHRTTESGIPDNCLGGQSR